MSFGRGDGSALRSSPFGDLTYFRRKIEEQNRAIEKSNYDVLEARKTKPMGNNDWNDLGRRWDLDSDSELAKQIIRSTADEKSLRHRNSKPSRSIIRKQQVIEQTLSGDKQLEFIKFFQEKLSEVQNEVVAKVDETFDKESWYNFNRGLKRPFLNYSDKQQKEILKIQNRILSKKHQDIMNKAHELNQLLPQDRDPTEDHEKLTNIFKDPNGIQRTTYRMPRLPRFSFRA